jgi:TPR repeat protein/serine/threonine protein kinase
VIEHIFPEGLEGEAHYFALPKGSKLFEFEISSVLGHGGFGITYLATDTHLQEQVAIKEYLPSDLAVRISDRTVRPKSADDKPSFEEGLKAFLKEAQLVARIRHTNIVRVRRFFEFHGTGCIVEDFEEGKSLSQRLNEGPLPEAELRVVLAGVLDGLEEVHERAVLHRDLKPNNIMLRANGTPVLIDFGAARDFRSRHSRSITAIATPGYTPPEQYGVGGQQGPWTDLYALGAILYRCVTATAPVDSLHRLRHDPLVPAAVAAAGGYDAALLGTIDWMLRIDEAERPASVSAVREALASGLARQPAWRTSASLTLKLAGAGRVLLELPESIRADVLELAFFATPPGQYLTPSLGGKPAWRKQPHYLEVYRTEGAAGHASFEVSAEVVSAIPAQAQVTICSADGFIRGSTVWPKQEEIKLPQRRWSIAAALAMFVLIVLMAGGLGLYTLYQNHLEQQRIEHLRQQLAAAKFDRNVLEGITAACSAGCPTDVGGEAARRLKVIAAEEASYQAAADDAEKLRAIASNCEACLVRPQALASAEQLDRNQQEVRRQRLVRQLQAAGSNLTDLEQFLRECGSTCPDDLRNQAQTSIDTIKREQVQRQHLEQQLQNAGSDRGALERFLTECGSSCPADLRSQAQTRIDAIKDKERRDSAVLRECDRLAAYSSDTTRPAGVVGVEFDQINSAQAVPACRDAVAIRPNDSRIMSQLGRALQKAGGADTAEAVRWYRKAADAGSALAMSNLGVMYNSGNGVQQDQAEAFRWFRKAADAEFPPAMHNLGAAYELGSGIAKNEAEGARWLRKAADAGYAPGMVRLGAMYRDGRGVERNEREALRLIGKAAEAGSPDGMSELGSLYATGKGVRKDETEAVRWYRKASEAGSATAMINLGSMYQNGSGVAKDEAEAFRWFRKAADAGVPAATHNLGLMYRDGKGVGKNEVEALRLFRMAADAGYAEGMSDVGFMYGTGRGVRKNEAEAVRWYRKAADAGSAVGMTNLGVMYRDGTGVGRDDAEAMRWFRKAADAGFPAAMSRLAIMYELGRGTAKDRTEALRWYRKAAAAGDADAKAALNRLAK